MDEGTGHPGTRGEILKWIFLVVGDTTRTLPTHTTYYSRMLQCLVSESFGIRGKLVKVRDGMEKTKMLTVTIVVCAP